MNIKQELKKAGQVTDNHESDLYTPVNDITRGIVSRYQYKCNVTIFRSNLDGASWYDIPFAFGRVR